MSFEGWGKCTLGDLVTFQRGHDLPVNSTVAGKYPVVGASGIIAYHNEFTSKAPCITIGRSGQGVGRPFYINEDSWAHNTTLYIKEFKNVDEQFIFYLLKTLNLGNYAGGSAVPTLNRNHIHPINVYIPECKKQQKAISSILAAIDDKIGLNTKINKKLEEIAQAIFKSWFVDFEPFKDGEFEESELGMIPKGWRVEFLGDICDINMGQSPPSDTYNSVGDGIPFYQGVKDFGFKYPSVTTYCNKPTKIANQFDVLFSVRAPVGEVNVAYEKCCIGRGISALRLKTHKNNMLYYLIKTIKKQFHDASNGSIFDAINKSGIEKEKIVIPNDGEIVDRFNDVIEPIDMELFNNYKTTKVLIQIRDSLLPKLMSGEIRVPVEGVS